MRLINRKRLLTLMAINEVSQRRLAAAAGYRSHAYLGRVLRGEADTVEPAAAERIARYFRIDIADLFAPRLSTLTGQFLRHHLNARLCVAVLVGALALAATESSPQGSPARPRQGVSR